MHNLCQCGRQRCVIVGVSVCHHGGQRVSMRVPPPRPDARSCVCFAGPDWWMPTACRMLPEGWCKVVATLPSNVSVVQVNPVEPPGSAQQLALMGIHPWLRVSNSSTWCVILGRVVRHHTLARVLRWVASALEGQHHDPPASARQSASSPFHDPMESSTALSRRESH